MKSKYATPFSVWFSICFLVSFWAMLSSRAAFGQATGAPGIITPVVAASPVVTILTAATGAMVRSQGAGNAALDLGSVSYFRGTSAPGESSQKRPGAFVITTRFALKVDCP